MFKKYFSTTDTNIYHLSHKLIKSQTSNMFDSCKHELKNSKKSFVTRLQGALINIYLYLLDTINNK